MVAGNASNTELMVLLMAMLLLHSLLLLMLMLLLSLLLLPLPLGGGATLFTNQARIAGQTKPVLLGSALRRNYPRGWPAMPGYVKGEKKNTHKVPRKMSVGVWAGQREEVKLRS